MKKVFFASFIVLLVIASCITIKPTDFSYYYNQTDSGLSAHIDINGYYVTTRECDSSFFSVFMFYPDGLFTIATSSNVDMVTGCFSSGGKAVICQYPLWGTYRLSGDTIKTQTIVIEGMGTSCIFRDYLIRPDKKIVNISDYAHAEKSKLMYMKNYPSFKINPCKTPAQFYPLSHKRDKKDCPYISKKWFYGK